MTAEEIFNQCIGLNAELGYVPIKKEDILEAMEAYHKEASKELVEALEVIVFIKNSIRYFEDYDPILIEAIDQAEEALEKHLKQHCKHNIKYQSKDENGFEVCKRCGIKL